MTTRLAFNPWLHRFAILVAVATLGLLVIGGLVTSHGVGMAVYDWPNSYGYNMFLFPISKWVGGILYEHSHRLMAALVGLLTTVLAGWLWARETCGRQRVLGLGAMGLVLLLMGLRIMPVYLVLGSLAIGAVALSIYRIKRVPDVLRWWGVMAFAGVILQGILGGLRVVWFKDQIGIFHATLAQLFFALTCALALFTSRWWQERTPRDEDREAKAAGQGPLSRLLWGTTCLILAQLVLGATMRHQHAGLAIPDFPLAYGRMWPAMDPASIAHYNAQRVETEAFNPITAAQVGLQMVHRLCAVAILVAVASCAWLAGRRLGAKNALSKLTLIWLALIFIQVLLGACTIWFNKAADVATAHVLTGALSLALGTIMSIISLRGLVLAQGVERVTASMPHPFAPHPAAAGLK